MKLKDKIAIVTGSGRGIGEAIAKKLASEGASIRGCADATCLLEVVEYNPQRLD